MNNHRVAACGLNGCKVNSFISESRECPIRVCAGHVFIIQNRISRSDGSACWHPITHHREATVCKLRCSAHFLGCFQLRIKMIRICISFSQSNYHLSTINSYQLLYSFKKAPNREKRKVTHGLVGYVPGCILYERRTDCASISAVRFLRLSLAEDGLNK